jgi:hypothetical protein
MHNFTSNGLNEKVPQHHQLHLIILIYIFFHLVIIIIFHV